MHFMPQSVICKVTYRKTFTDVFLLASLNLAGFKWGVKEKAIVDAYFGVCNS